MEKKNKKNFDILSVRHFVCRHFVCRHFVFRHSVLQPHGAPATTKDRRHLINNHESLVRFCREYVNKPLTAFLENWSH